MARRRYQNGCLFKRGKNWVLRYREDVLNTDQGLERTHRSIVLGPLASKKEARQAADAHLLQFNAVTRRPQATLTLGNLWSRYFVPEILPVLKFSTRRLYRTLATKHLLPEFGGERLCDVARVQIQQFIGQKQRQGYSTQTLAHFRNLLSKLFGVAVLWGWMNDNPARGIKLPSMERVRKARVLSVEEVGLLSRSLSDPTCIIFKLGLLTGLRIGELLALRVEDLDLVGLRLYVRRNVYCGHVGTTKTKASEREIPLASALVSNIACWLTARPGRSEWLFPSEAGTPYHDRNLLTRNVHPICDSLGIQRFGWHSLRHTFTTYGGNNGVPLPVLQSLLGHSSAETSMIYTHPLDAAKRQAVERLTRILFPNVPIQGSANGAQGQLIH